MVAAESSAGCGDKSANGNEARATMHTILLVDDDAVLRRTLSRLLERAGFNLLEAADGRQAMDLLAEKHVDLTVIDIFMPNVDGMEFTIRVKRSFPEAKIITMTGGGTVDTQSVLDIARRYGADRTITKPFEIPEFLSTVNDVLALPPPGQGTGLSDEVCGEWGR